MPLQRQPLRQTAAGAAIVLACLAHGRTGATGQAAAPAADPPAATSELRDLVDRYLIDRAALLRRYPVAIAPQRLDRMARFYKEWEERIGSVDFDTLGQEGRLDHVLLRARLAFEQRLVARESGWLQETAPLLPFAPVILSLDDARLRMESLDAVKAAAALDRLAGQIDATRRAVDAGLKRGESAGRPGTNGAPTPIRTTPLVAFRAQAQIVELSEALEQWSGFYAGYDPLFTWWADAPLRKTLKALESYRALLRTGVLGIPADGDEPIVGTPIGRAALAADLQSELIPYTPDELLALGERELAWCEREMTRAAREMGLGDDWKAALEKVKSLHVEPGRQPDLIRDLAREAEEYVETHDLITVPPLAKEVWRMQMMSPERQRVNPFFTGGETIAVSFPTSGMEHGDKVMSLRGNNIHFARATVHHELIPGHHLQQFMNARYNSHRNAFRTPFWLEGWALYWEMLLWDRGFPATPENRVGMLFWRMHRAARIIFSLRFHLGEWTPQQSVDFLVDRVGHERANAEGEVRRSFNGTYPPLYQLAYMIGGLQFRALHRELVGGGRLTNRQFHDAIVTGGMMPVEMVRVRLLGQPVARDYTARWRFADAPSPGR